MPLLTHRHPQLQTTSYLSQILELAVCECSVSSRVWLLSRSTSVRTAQAARLSPACRFSLRAISTARHRGPCLTHPHLLTDSPMLSDCGQLCRELCIHIFIPLLTHLLPLTFYFEITVASHVVIRSNTEIVSISSSNLHNNTVSQPRNWPWYDSSALFRLYQLCALVRIQTCVCVCVCVCVCAPCSLPTRPESCSLHHSEGGGSITTMPFTAPVAFLSLLLKPGNH